MLVMKIVLCAWVCELHAPIDSMSGIIKRRKIEMKFEQIKDYFWERELIARVKTTYLGPIYTVATATLESREGDLLITAEGITRKGPGDKYSEEEGQKYAEVRALRALYKKFKNKHEGIFVWYEG